MSTFQELAIFGDVENGVFYEVTSPGLRTIPIPHSPPPDRDEVDLCMQWLSDFTRASDTASLHSVEDLLAEVCLVYPWTVFSKGAFILASFRSGYGFRPDDSDLSSELTECKLLLEYVPEGVECAARACSRAERVPITPSQRFEIFEDDGFRCRICGTSVSQGATLEVDHIIPVSKGGTNERSNLWTACFLCNRGKGVRDMSIPKEINA